MRTAGPAQTRQVLAAPLLVAGCGCGLVISANQTLALHEITKAYAPLKPVRGKGAKMWNQHNDGIEAGTRAAIAAIERDLEHAARNLRGDRLAQERRRVAHDQPAFAVENGNAFFFADLDVEMRRHGLSLAVPGR